MWLALDDADYIRDTLAFSGTRIALRVDRDLIAADGSIAAHDTRYFLTALDPEHVTADKLLRATRDHWQVENSLFYCKDRWWDEDRHRTRRPGLAEILAQLTSFALSVIRICYSTAEPVRARADAIQWQPRIGMRLLGLV